MVGFGLGFGAHSISRQYSVLGQNVPPATLSPSAQWNGTAASGYAGAPPLDPTRSTAKPICRLLVPPNQYFTDELVVGVWACANNLGSLLDNLGIEKVIVHCEGETAEIAAPSHYLFADANGELVQYLGWWAILQHPGIQGHAQVYFEAVPKDSTMQRRIIGPYLFSPQPQLHDFEIEIAPTPPEIVGSRYKSLHSAMSYLRLQAAQNPRIIVTEAAEYNFGALPAAYAGKGHCTIEATVPITIKKPGFAIGNSARLFRPLYDGLWLRGANITIDFHHADSIYHENAANSSHVFDGIRFTDGGGDYYTYLLGPKTTFQIARNAPFYLECQIDTIPGACNNAGLVRGCTIEGGSNDSAQAASCVIGSTIRNWNSDAWRIEIPAMTVQYNGSAATATLSLSGGNVTNNRVLTAKVAGTVVGSFNILNTEAAYSANTNYTVQNVVDWINGLTDWTASLLDNTRYAAALSTMNNNGAAFTDQSVKAGRTFVTFFDIHPDIWQHVGTVENRVFAFNNCYNNVAQSIFLNVPISDFAVLGCTFHQDMSSVDSTNLVSQFNTAHRHVVVAHNTSANQALFLRADFSYSPDTYCLLANNVLPNIIWLGTPKPNLKIVHNHLYDGATSPVGSLNTTIGGTMVSTLTDPQNGNFMPQGALLDILKTPVLRHDLDGFARSVLAVPGALVGPDAIAPAITNANPSGTYIENSPLGGVLTANKQVSWSVSGQDAAAVSIDSASGIWSLEATDYEGQTEYEFAFVATDRVLATDIQLVAITIADADEVAPTLSAASGAPTGSSAANISILTNEASGTLHWVVTTSPTPPSPALLIAGVGVAAGGSIEVDVSGEQIISASGLSASTSYFAHFLQIDGAGNQSSISSSVAFKTNAIEGAEISVVATEMVLNTSYSGTSFVGGPFICTGGSDRLLAAVVTMTQQVDQNVANIAALLDGVPMTRIGGAAHSAGTSHPACGIFVASIPSGGSKIIDVQVAGGARSCIVLALEIANVDAANVLANVATTEGNIATYSHSYTPTSAENLVLSVLATKRGEQGPFVPDQNVTSLLNATTGGTPSHDHSVFVGYHIPNGTGTIQVGASAPSDSEAVYVVTELNTV